MAQTTRRNKKQRAKMLSVALSGLVCFSHASASYAQSEEKPEPAPAKLEPAPTKSEPALTGTELSRARNFEVLYVTTRANDGSPLKPNYGSRRNLDMGAGSLEYGTCRIERPASALAFPAASNFQNFKTAMAATDHDWLAAPMKRIDRLSMPDFLVKVKNWRGPIMVFIHGYDESFDKAMKDAAMIAYQFDCKGDSAVLPICFSWPSLNNKAEYAADEANLEWSTAAFFEFIDTIKTAKNPTSPLDMVAHSMGNRPLIQYCFQHRGENASFRNIVLSGGDIDFHTAEARKHDIEAAAERSVTVIVSDRDAPLITSQLLHRQPRLGRPIDPPTMRAQKSDLLGSSFWTQLTLDASALILPNAFNMDPDVGRWINQNPKLGREFGEKTIFIDVTDLVSGELGHRLAFPVIAGILRETLAPLSSTVVYKRPDKLTLEAMGGSPRWLYRFHKIDSNKFRQ
jgi:esterase/lipase superfamily enzyme